jgi:hypothetical protein
MVCWLSIIFFLKCYLLEFDEFIFSFSGDIYQPVEE